MDADGVRAVVESTSHAWEDREPHAVLRRENGDRVAVPTGALALQPDGTYRLPFSLDGAAQEPSYPADALVVPVVAEELVVETRPVETGRVRITKTVQERAEVVDEPLLQERVAVERVPVGRVVEGPVAVRYEGDVMIVPVLEEVLVVEKRLMLTEELRITRQRTEKRAPQTVTLRREEVSVERVPPKNQPED